ncbi:MAG: hypothetical protein ABIH72_00400 [archaeon]
MTSNRDLRKYQDSDAVQDAFSRIVSGRSGYKAIIEKDKPKLYCNGCSKLLEGEEKFCPECGTKIEFKK